MAWRSTSQNILRKINHTFPSWAERPTVKQALLRSFGGLSNNVPHWIRSVLWLYLLYISDLPEVMETVSATFSDAIITTDADSFMASNKIQHRCINSENGLRSGGLSLTIWSQRTLLSPCAGEPVLLSTSKGGNSHSWEQQVRWKCIYIGDWHGIITSARRKQAEMLTRRLYWLLKSSSHLSKANSAKISRALQTEEDGDGLPSSSRYSGTAGTKQTNVWGPQWWTDCWGEKIHKPILITQTLTYFSASSSS